MLADAVPQLRLRDKDKLPGLVRTFHEIDYILTPDIGKAAEAEALEAEQILHSPHESKLNGNIARGAEEISYPRSAESLVEEFEVKGVGEIAVVHKEVNTEKEILVDANQTVILNLKAERRQYGVLPEIKAAGNLHVTAAGSLVHTFGVLSVEVIINEKEGVTPIVIVEAFKGGGEMTTVSPEIIEGLKIGLGLRSLREGQHSNCCSKE